jgi:hypothetical protein
MTVETDSSSRQDSLQASRGFLADHLQLNLHTATGHERSLTQIMYNKEGDLLFTASKDHVINAWFSTNGERLGTYNGHNGTIWTIACDCACKRLYKRENTFPPTDQAEYICASCVGHLYSPNQALGIRIRRQPDETVGHRERKVLADVGIPHCHQKGRMERR